MSARGAPPAAGAAGGGAPRRLRALFVSDVYFPRINGVSTSLDCFADELRRRGHTVELLAPRYGDEAVRLGVLRVPSRRVPFDPEDRMMKAQRALALEATLRRYRFDLVHVHTPFVAHHVGTRLARRLGLPLVLTYHTFFAEYLHHYVPLAPARWLRGLARTVSRRQCQQADAVVVPSSAMRDVLAGYGVTTAMEVLPTGLPLAELAGGSGAAFRAHHGIPAERPTLVHVGRMAHEKNVGFLLEVVERARRQRPDVLLVLAGEGPALPALRRQAREMGVGANTLFVGYLDRRRELLDCYRAADAFLFASRTETQGLVLLEAMALGVPVV
ncbi:MAG TPA: glycosyltransferase, partial [Thermoanaerobaculia bacterium]|nr:glycosyltransferase [Thermoanaerobaculia bacterium]